MENVDQGKSKDFENLKMRIGADVVGFLGIPLVITLFSKLETELFVLCLSIIGLGLFSSYCVYQDMRSFYEDE